MHIVEMKKESFEMEDMCHGCFKTVLISAAPDEFATDKILEWQRNKQLCDDCRAKKPQS